MSNAARVLPVASATASSARCRATKHAVAWRWRGLGVGGDRRPGTWHRGAGVRLGERHASDGGRRARLAPRAEAPESPEPTAVSDVAQPSPPPSETAPVDPDAPPPLSPAAQKAVAEVDREVRAASASSADLARPSAPNAYLPRSAGFSLPLPPEPVRFPRTKLSLRLAVLLLRSGYETVDAMDILPMDQFQVKFWKSRQAEWEPYKFQYAPLVIEQGKLEDPLYFDFISYMQFNVVAREMPNSAGVFEERSGAEGTTKVVRRDPSLADNAILPAVFAQRLGDTIYARLRYGFEDTEFPGCPEPAKLVRAGDAGDAAAESSETLETNFATIEKGVAALTKCMVDKGYGLRSDVTAVPTTKTADTKKRRLKIVVEGVANLWGAQALAARGVSPPNEYLGFALTAYCRASGVGSFYAAKATDTAVEIELTVTMP